MLNFNYDINNWVILYVLLVLIGFGVRVNIVSPLVASPQNSFKKITFQIALVIAITLLWGIASSREKQNLSAMIVMIVTIIYSAYVLSQKVEKDGYIHSFLVFINGYFVTAISFMSVSGKVVWGVIVIVLAIIIYRKLEPEHKSILLQIIIMIVEIIISSLIVMVNKWNGVLQTILVTIFVETFVYTINLVIGYFCVWICGEDTNEYMNTIKGIR